MRPYTLTVLLVEPEVKIGDLMMLDRIGPYELKERIAFGGMAEVYRAVRREARGFERPLAVKAILEQVADDPDYKAMFLDEARLAGSLVHPNIVQVFDFGEDGDRFYLAMEYVEGTSLRELMAYAGAPLPVPLALVVAVDLCKALFFAHSQRRDGVSLGLVHRDISPHNVLLTQEGELKLADFGIAKTRARFYKTRTGQIKGKVGYMSPEQVLGKEVDRRSDIFSLGIVLHEMLTGRRLFGGGPDELAAFNRILVARVTPPSMIQPQVPKELDRIVLRALERDVDRRTGDAGILLHQLAALSSLEEYLRAQEDLGELVRMAAAHRQSLGQGRTLVLGQGPAGSDDPTRTRRKEVLLSLGEPSAEAGGGTGRLKPLALMAASLAFFLSGVALFLGGGGSEGQASLVGAVVVGDGGAEAGPMGDGGVDAGPVRDSGVEAGPVRDGPPLWDSPLPRDRPSRPDVPLPGRLTVNTDPWSQVFLNGALLGTTPIQDHRLRPGRYQLVLRNPKLGLERKMAIRIRPQRLTRVIETL